MTYINIQYMKVYEVYEHTPRVVYTHRRDLNLMKSDLEWS